MPTAYMAYLNKQRYKDAGGSVSTIAVTITTTTTITAGNGLESLTIAPTTNVTVATHQMSTVEIVMLVVLGIVILVLVQPYIHQLLNAIQQYVRLKRNTGDSREYDTLPEGDLVQLPIISTRSTEDAAIAPIVAANTNENQ